MKKKNRRKQVCTHKDIRKNGLQVKVEMVLEENKARAASGRGRHCPDPVCVFQRNQHSGLLDGRSQVQGWVKGIKSHNN